LWKHRIVAATEVLKAAGARRVIDLGCGEGKLLRAWLNEPSFTELVGMDVSHRSLEIAELRLRSERVKLLHGSLMYRDERIAGFDGAAIIEVIEHLDPPRLAAFERVVFAYARPATVVITTPNAEYNVRYESLAEGEHRHSDHRFEWTRKEFESWASRVASDFGYRARFDPVGEVDPDVGAPTQMGVFSR
jgi:3' terminal RNA ribose 2'-O-methyltransferase Hen1